MARQRLASLEESNIRYGKLVMTVSADTLPSNSAKLSPATIMTTGTLFSIVINEFDKHFATFKMADEILRNLAASMISWLWSLEQMNMLVTFSVTTARPCSDLIWVVSIYFHPQGQSTHNDVIKWKHFPRYWPFVRRIHRSQADSPDKDQWRRAFMFFLSAHEQTIEQTRETLVTIVPSY